MKRWVFASLVLHAIVPPVAAQLFEPSTTLKNARLITQSGPVVPRGNIVIKGSRIVALGPTASAGLFARSVDLTGKTVTPGLIDAWSALGHTGNSAKNDPTATAWDAFDPYARDQFREALRQGVTTIYLAPGGRPGITGMGVIVQLLPAKGGAAGSVLRKEAALAIDLGSGRKPISRAKRLAALRKRFRTAIEYRKSLEDYEEDLKEYLDKLKQRNKEAEQKEKKAKDESPDQKPDNEPSPDKDKPDKETENSGWKAVHTAKKKPEKEGDKEDQGRGKNGKKNGKKDEKEEELKKPKKPKRDPVSALLLRSMDREFPVRVQAHLSSDIQNALDLAEEFNLDLVLEGATEAYLLADTLADADVKVVLGPVARPAVYSPDAYRRHTERNAAILSHAGVLWTLGSGADTPLSARFVAQNAQLASAYGAGDWLTTVTTTAARVLGLDRQLGRLTAGAQADLVVWSGDPGDPASIVERVYIAGKLAYLAPSLRRVGGAR